MTKLHEELTEKLQSLGFGVYHKRGPYELIWVTLSGRWCKVKTTEKLIKKVLKQSPTDINSFLDIERVLHTKDQDHKVAILLKKYADLKEELIKEDLIKEEN